jgi:hypothetical protein
MKTDSFALRHIGPRENDLQHIFKTIGVESLDQLIYETVPNNIRLKKDLDLDAPMTEYEYLTHIQELGKKNKVFKSYIGLGYHPAIVPAVIQRNIFENPGWYTAYTPYQAEIAQGRLEAILNYQTTIIELTGMEIANAYIKFKGNDKHRLNSVVNRLKAGIEDIINLHPDPEVKKAVMEDLDDKSDDMISRVYFIDQALRIPEEHLEPIADIINDYLNIHYPPKDEEEQMWIMLWWEKAMQDFHRFLLAK